VVYFGNAAPPTEKYWSMASGRGNGCVGLTRQGKGKQGDHKEEGPGGADHWEDEGNCRGDVRAPFQNQEAGTAGAGGQGRKVALGMSKTSTAIEVYQDDGRKSNTERQAIELSTEPGGDEERVRKEGGSQKRPQKKTQSSKSEAGSTDRNYSKIEGQKQ